MNEWNQSLEAEAENYYREAQAERLLRQSFLDLYPTWLRQFVAGIFYDEDAGGHLSGETMMATYTADGSGKTEIIVTPRMFSPCYTFDAFRTTMDDHEGAHVVQQIALANAAPYRRFVMEKTERKGQLALMGTDGGAWQAQEIRGALHACMMTDEIIRIHQEKEARSFQLAMIGRYQDIPEAFRERIAGRHAKDLGLWQDLRCALGPPMLKKALNDQLAFVDALQADPRHRKMSDLYGILKLDYP